MQAEREAMAAAKACVLSYRQLASVADFLFPHEAFATAQISKTWQQAADSLDARQAVLRLRPLGWSPDASDAKCLQDRDFCKRLLRDWYQCLSRSALQVAYVDHSQHVVFVDPSTKVVPPPQGSDLFPIDTDADRYRCVIDGFSLDRLWWKCLEQELFYWPMAPRSPRRPPIRDDGSERFASERDELEYSDTRSVPADGFDWDENDLVVARSTEEEMSQASDQRGSQEPGGERNARGYRPEALPAAPEEPAVDTEGVSSEPAGPRSCKAVPGYTGDCTPPSLRDDVIAVLALNAAWFTYSFWSRQVQAILLLRDGRYLLLGASEMQGTIDSQAGGLACPCFVAGSLASLVVLAQDDASRAILHTKVPKSEESSSRMGLTRLSASGQRLTMPRVEGDVGQEDVFGLFLRADKVLEGLAKPPLFSNTFFDQDEARSKIRPGDICRVQRTSPTFIFKSCRAEDWGVEDGPVSPCAVEEYSQRARTADLRFISFSGGCHLGLRAGRFYSAEVCFVDAANATVDVLYTDPTEWADGNSGFTGSRGSSAKHHLPPLQEADVSLDRVLLLPTNATYQTFMDAWYRCGSFVTMSLDFEHGAGSPPRETRKKTHEQQEVASSACSFLELADLFRDTRHAHEHRCKLLSEEAAVMAEEAGDLERCAPEGMPKGKLWPPPAQMSAGKTLMLKLLRKESFWKKWVDQGGESADFFATLFKRPKFVRLCEGPMEDETR